MNALLAIVMIFLEPIPFAEALQSREVKSVLPTDLGSADLESIFASLRERATFSARVTNAEYLQTIDDVLEKFVNGDIDLATARLELKDKLLELGYTPDPEDAGTIKDFSSDRRTNLVLNMNADFAQGYGWFTQGQDPAILDQFPGQEFYDTNPGKIENRRDWHSRWLALGGKIFDGRLIALKDDPIWEELSRFGTPYPPFDYGSYWNVRDVDRDTCIGYGLIDRDTQIEPQDRGFNDDLQLTPEIRNDSLRQALLESDDRLVFDGDILTMTEGG